MKHKKEEVKKTEGKGPKETSTCVCNMEWFGTHDNAWGDCTCTSDEEDKGKKGYYL